MEPASQFLPAVDKPESLKDIAYRVLKDAILTLKFRPGQALSHRELATQLQISETPIRDALQDLEREGFVCRIAYKGTYVTEIDPLDIEETFQIRSALEALATRLAIPRLNEDDLKEMAGFLESAQKALKEGDRAQCSHFGAQFHRLLIQKAGNRRLAAILNNLEDHSARFRRISDRISGRLEKSQGEHREVYEAALAGDAERAGRATHDHLQSILTDIGVLEHSQAEE